MIGPVFTPVEAAIFNHRFGPAWCELFRELMDEDDISGKINFRKGFRQDEQRRRMGIMAASVHRAVHF